jgi:uncharacterized protein (TIGR03000 family)
MYSVVLMAALSAAPATPSFCWGRGCHGCYGCYGCYGCHGWHAYKYCYGCHGCYGCYGCYGWGGCYGGYACYGCAAPVIVQPANPAPPVVPPEKPKEGDGEKKEPKENPEQASKSNQARVVVELPKDAKLYFDDTLMKTTSEKRVFRTPQLQPGQAYYYILRAEVERDGKTISETKRIIVRAGEEVSARFPELGAETTARR